VTPATPSLTATLNDRRDGQSVVAGRDDLFQSGEESALNRTDAERVQQALDAAIDGDVEPFVALLAPDLEWRGVERGHLWWRRAPS
jgi:hypothetical protein